MRILVVEDDHKIAAFVLKGLTDAGFAVDRAADGDDGLRLAMSVPYSAAVVDIMLLRPGWLESLIEEGPQTQIANTPVIIPEREADPYWTNGYEDFRLVATII